MSSKASLYYNNKEDVHLYREMGDNSIYLRTKTYEVAIPECLGRLLHEIDFDELEHTLNNNDKGA